MKKLTPFFAAVAILLTLITGCKKPDNNNNNNNNSNAPNQQYGGGPDIPTDAAGALYAINSTTVTNTYGYYDSISEGYPMGWFTSTTQTKYAGAVTCNSEPLSDSIAGYLAPWYTLDVFNSSGFVDFSGGNDVMWQVSGNSASGIAPFTYTDNTPWPTVTGFNLSSSISSNVSLTVPFTLSGSIDGVFCMLYSQSGNKVVHSANTNATSITFTASEIAQVGSSGQMVGVEIMPYSIKSSTIAGKKYYFVKQSPLAKFTTLQ